MAATISVGLLGGVEVSSSVAGRLNGSPRAISLLAYLVSRPEIPQPRAHLALLLWPDSEGAQARTNLRRELHNLRTLLGDSGCLQVDSQSLSWRRRPDCVIDVHDFLDACHRTDGALAAGDREGVQQHGDRVLALYKGPFLLGCYDDWALEIRQELQRACVELCDRIAAYWLSLGDPTAAAVFARRRVLLEPLEEPGYRMLMRAQREARDRAGAMRTYHQCASVLERELGVTPAPETQAELDLVLSALNSGRSDVDPEPGTTAAWSLSAEMVGREAQRAQLLSAWDHAQADCRLVVVVGGAGVGKTRLVADLTDTVRKQDTVVATTRCFTSTSAVPLAPVADWLRSPHLRMAAKRLDPVWRSEVDRLVPVGVSTADPGYGVRAKVDAWQRSRFFEGLVRAFLAVDRPVLLTIDDLHWCDKATLSWLSMLMTFRGPGPLLVVATARDDEFPNSDLACWLEGMQANGQAQLLALENLSTQSAAQLAAGVLGHALDEDELSLMMTVTAGNPFFLLEALRKSSSTPGPVELADLRDVLDSRLTLLPEPAREVVELAAAIGRDFTLELLIEASDLAEGHVVRQVDELWRRRIFEERGRGYDFAHDLLREAAYRMVSPPRRWLLHRRLAQALELLWSGRLDDVAPQLAEQYDMGGRPERALPFYERAARAANAVFAHAEAVRFWQRCLSLLGESVASTERDRRELGVLQELLAPLNAWRGYASVELEKYERRAHVLGEHLGLAEVRCTAAIALFATTFVQGHTRESSEWAKQALSLSAQRPELSAQAHLALAGSGLSLGRLRLADEHFRSACDLAGSSDSMPIGTRTSVHARSWWAHARWLLGDEAGALAASAEAVQAARLIHHPYSLAVALSYAAITQQLLGNTLLLAEILRELTKLCAHHDFAYYRQWATVLTGWTQGGATGLRDAQRGIELLTREGSLARMPYWLSLAADLHHRQGDATSAVASLDAAASIATENDDRWWLPEVLRSRATLDPNDRSLGSLHRAAAMARSQSSVSLLALCLHDIETHDRG